MRPAPAQTRVLRGDPRIWAEMGRAQAAGGRVRKRRLRMALRCVVLLLACAGALKAGQVTRGMLYSDPSFRIRRIVVKGPVHRDSAPVQDALKSLQNTSLWELMPEEVGECLTPFPWVQGFTCRKHLPSTLVVEVKERSQLCAVSAGGRVLELDGTGRLWPALPGVSGVFRIEDGLKAGDPAVQKFVEDLLKAGLAGKVEGLAPGGGGSIVLLTSDGWALKVLGGEDLREQWGHFEAARSWLDQNYPGRRRLDLRWGGKIVLEAPTEGEPDQETSITG